MHKFGSTGILTGYIKQMLASFNLPTVKIYTKEHEEYFKRYGKEREDIFETFRYDLDNSDGTTGVLYIPYIKDGRLQEYVDGKWRSVGTTDPTRTSSNALNPHWHIYDRGRFMLNKTKRFQIRDNVYDYYTHEYLGDYLRFLRDFDGINLMPLYNCFSNRICSGLSFDIQYETDYAANYYTTTFDTSDLNYRIYALPVKIAQTYTIAIDSSSPVELCCGLYGAHYEKDPQLADLFAKTYSRQTYCQFSQPFLYNKLEHITSLDAVTAQAQNLDPVSASTFIAKHRALLLKLAQREKDLHLFIKVPSQAHTSIVVLEGNYQHWNDSLLSSVPSIAGVPAVYGSGEATSQSPNLNLKLQLASGTNPVRPRTNHSLISNEALLASEDFEMCTPLQLLKMNTGQHYPFADRLIEYLLGNCITGGDDELKGNVELAQNIVRKKYELVKYPAKDDSALFGTSLEPKDILMFKYNPEAAGLWENRLRKIFYQHMSTKVGTSANHDILGYVDKDVEKYFSIRTLEGKNVSMLNSDRED